MDGVELEREIDLPRGIVWEALVDPFLVAGWLHPAEKLVTGTTPVLFAEPDTPRMPAVLHVVSPVFGDLRFELRARSGGTRGERTVLTLRLPGRGAADGTALWELRLDALSELLRGHPVEWDASGATAARPEAAG